MRFAIEQVKELQAEMEKLGEEGEVEKAEELMKKIAGLVGHPLLAPHTDSLTTHACARAHSHTHTHGADKGEGGPAGVHRQRPLLAEGEDADNLRGEV